MCSIKDICEKIWELEKEHNLLFIDIGNVKIWQAIRWTLPYRIANLTGSYNIPHTIKDSFSERLRNFPSFLKSCLFYNPFFSRKERKVLVFDHSRKTLLNGEYVDIYTKYLIEKLEERGASFEVYEEPHLNRHYTRRERNRKHLDFILIFANLYAILFKYRFNKSERKYLSTVSGEIDEHFNIRFDLLKFFSFEIQKFRALHFLFKKLFQIKKPEKVFVLVGYGHAALIKAAKEQGVEVIELQHGVINEYHLGYSFPGIEKGSIDYFPDKLYLWEESWKEMCDFPIEDEAIVVCGFEHLEREKEKYTHIAKKENGIVVISQGTIGPQLADIILQNIDDLKSYEITYKLHPGEYDRWKSYPSLLTLSTYPNIKIIDNNEIPLYQLLSEASYLIGAYSTVIFESLHFNCKIILVEVPGIESMFKLIEAGKAKLLQEGKRLRTLLKSYE